MRLPIVCLLRGRGSDVASLTGASVRFASVCGQVASKMTGNAGDTFLCLYIEFLVVRRRMSVGAIAG